ncbi:polygalacturonase-like [Prosopis cineraria]|uniref:polygalacturonase-like n=1 Tax=Prosopis cineraria TaxID=364024 RepID=UPI0024101F51|nr:polygalacturonase-like [Prosopis cineraria]
MTISIFHLLLPRVALIVLLMIFLQCSSFNSASASVANYNVVSFGAKPDGETDCTKAFLSAWEKACGSAEPAAIYVPRGKFLLGKAEFTGECNNKAISITIDGTLLAPSNYHVTGGNDDDWIVFHNVDGVSIRGGMLDGKGTALWACKNSGGNCPSGATSLKFINCKNIKVTGLTSVNSQMFHIVIHESQHVKLQGVKVAAPGDSPNTDGIHIGGSDDVTILNSNIRTGDDCVSVGPGTTNLWVENIACGPGHGISIGSLGKDENEEGVRNVTVKTVKFTGTENGVRIKTWGKPCNAFVRDVVFQHAVMVDVKNPIVIDQNYCPDHDGCPQQASGVKISDVKYQDIHGSSATEVAVKFDCSSENPCSGIALEDVRLTYNNQIAQASCRNAGGTSQGLVQPESCL